MVFKTKSKLLIASVAIVALLVIVLPYSVSALPTSNSNVTASKTLLAKGIATQSVNGEKVNVPASLTLTLTNAADKTNVNKFVVTGGSIVVNGITYTITSGNGGVLYGKHLILLQAQGTGSNGETVTLKLEGRYFWMGAHLYVIRVGAKLQTDNGDFTSLLRAAIRV